MFFLLSERFNIKSPCALHTQKGKITLMRLGGIYLRVKDPAKPAVYSDIIDYTTRLGGLSRTF